MGPPQARQALLETVMMGAHSGTLVSDRRFGGADVLATSYTLAQAIRGQGRVDLVPVSYTHLAVYKRQELIFKRDFYEEACAAYLYQLLALFGRKARTGKEEAAPSDRRIGQICCQIQREYNKNVPLEQYAAGCCLSMSLSLIHI